MAYTAIDVPSYVYQSMAMQYGPCSWHTDNRGNVLGIYNHNYGEDLVFVDGGIGGGGTGSSLSTQEIEGTLRKVLDERGLWGKQMAVSSSTVGSSGDMVISSTDTMFDSTISPNTVGYFDDRLTHTNIEDTIADDIKLLKQEIEELKAKNSLDHWIDRHNLPKNGDRVTEETFAQIHKYSSLLDAQTVYTMADDKYIYKLIKYEGDANERSKYQRRKKPVSERNGTSAVEGRASEGCYERLEETVRKAIGC